MKFKIIIFICFFMPIIITSLIFLLHINGIISNLPNAKYISSISTLVKIDDNNKNKIKLERMINSIIYLGILILFIFLTYLLFRAKSIAVGYLSSNK